MRYRDELIKERIRLEIKTESMNPRFLVDERIDLPVYGEGIIIAQDATRTTVRFDQCEHTFEIDRAETERFIDDSDLVDIKNRLTELDKVLINQFKDINVQKLVQNLLSKWSKSSTREDIIVAADVVTNNPEKWTKEEKPILENISALLSKEEWQKLPKFIIDVYDGKKIKLNDDLGFDDFNQFKLEIEAELKRERLLYTKDIICSLIEVEQYKEKKRQELSAMREIMRTDYLSVRNFLRDAEIINMEDFEEESLNFVEGWFKKNEAAGGKTPDKEQLAAISTCNKNVEVIARAGSGKTATILNRAQFLIEHCNVSPESILILAFNKKAVAEMQDRMTAANKKVGRGEEDNPFIETFHALAHSIHSPLRQRLLFDNIEEYDDFSDSGKELSQTIQNNIIDEMIRDPFFGQQIKGLMINCFKKDWGAIVKGGYNLQKEELLYLRRYAKETTLAGETVSCREEKQIADTLLENGLNYKYSSQTGCFSLQLPGYIKVRFSYSEEKKKNKTDNKNKQYTFFVNSEIIRNQEIVRYISWCLTPFGIRLKKISEEQLWNKIRERAIDQFTKAMIAFINRCRKKNLTVMQLYNMINHHVVIRDEERLFLNIAQEVYRRYIGFMKENKQIDFDGLMFEAAARVARGKTTFKENGKWGDIKRIKHILIDEYQDFSYPFDTLIKEIQKVVPDVTLFCVGDDCQAINSFAGSDLEYFNNFAENHEDSKVYHLLTNYRSVPEIVGAGNIAIGAFDTELKVKPNRSEKGLVKIGYMDDFIKTYEEESADLDDMTAMLLRLVKHILSKEKAVVLLTRRNATRKHIQKEILDKLSNDEKIRMSIVNGNNNDTVKTDISFTVHKYKGKQKYAIIIVDALDKNYPLLHPTWYFQRIFGETMDKIVENERRLYYVAVTRAEDELYILTSRGEETPFLQKGLPVLEWADYISDNNQVLVETTTIEVSNYISKGTFGIKDHLKQAGFKYNPSKENWTLVTNMDNAEEELIHASWLARASNIRIDIRRGKNQQKKSYIVIQGQIRMI